MNRKLKFTNEGYLTPIEGIELDLTTFQTVFVDEFPNSKTRHYLFDNYLEYLRLFSRKITPQFEQWINGSFVTQKENPNDIDFVTFIDASIFEILDISKKGFIKLKINNL